MRRQQSWMITPFPVQSSLKDVSLRKAHCFVFWGVFFSLRFFALAHANASLAVMTAGEKKGGEDG